ncbi:MAG: hypothetical protein HUU56_04535 [Bdellovibrionaceae bacterium]|nr:hypothetical protein [Pseudobdellovibrionaceae bacterium]
MVSENIYIQGEYLKNWLDECKLKTQKFYSYLDQKNQRQELDFANTLLAELKVSHLQIFDEQESSKIWEEWDLQNGLNSQYINGDLVITRVEKLNSGKISGLKMGDVVKSFNGDVVSPEIINTQAGTIVVSRKNKELKFQLYPEKILEDNRLEILEVNNVSVLKVPSFKAKYFSYQELDKIMKNLENKKKILIDMRGNAGGNFVAGLRFLSYFICQPQKIGSFIKSKKENKFSVAELPDDLDDDLQIDILNQSHRVELSTFATRQCILGKVGVIINSQTASTAEMVANTFREINKAKIFGAGSSGQLLVGIWYNLDHIWSGGVKIMIPEAEYISRENKKIEEVGVTVDKVIYDRLSDYQNGSDSWLEQASKEM